jgi:hypothetical protein
MGSGLPALRARLENALAACLPQVLLDANAAGAAKSGKKKGGKKKGKK